MSATPLIFLTVHVLFIVLRLAYGFDIIFRITDTDKARVRIQRGRQGPGYIPPVEAHGAIAFF